MSTEPQLQKSFKNASFRLSAYNIINNIFIGKAYPDQAVRKEINRLGDIDQQYISTVNELVYGVVRWKLKLDCLIDLNLSREIKKMQIRNLLRIGVYQLLFMDGIKDHASVNETVKLSKDLFSPKIGNFINAVLRGVQRKKNAEIKFKNKVEEISFNHSFPKWIIEYWLKNYEPEKVENLCKSLNKVADINLRVNTLKISRENLVEELKRGGISASNSRISESGIVLNTRIDPANTNLYKQGFYSIQDEASQLISTLLNPQPGEKVLDACSAPGGKTCHIAEMMGNKGEILSVDSNKNRLRLLKKQIERLGIDIVKTRQSDLSTSNNMKNYEKYFDKILVDAPCSGLGTIRRNPDIKWTREMPDINYLSALQYKILKNVCSTLKTGGLLVYSVCTLSKRENEDIIEKFLEENPGFAIEEAQKSDKINEKLISKNYFISYSDIFDMDSFFAAKLKRIN